MTGDPPDAAGRSAADPAPGRRALYREVLSRLPQVRRVAFLVRAQDLDEVAATVRQWPDVEFVVIAPGAPAPQDPRVTALGVHRSANFARIHGLLAARGPLDVIIEEPGEHGAGTYLTRLLYHLRVGGLYMAGHDPAEVRADVPPRTGNLHTAVAAVVQSRTADPYAASPLSPDDRSLARSVTSVDVEVARTVLVRAANPAQVKLRHTELSFVTRHASGPAWVSEISQVPPTTVDASGAVGVHNDPARWERLYPTTLKVPSLVVREYAGVTAQPYGILRRGHLLLPDTFRLWMSSRQRHGRVPDLAHYFGSLPPVPEDPPRLTGQYYYLDLEHRFHFGHYLTEAVGRLWAWPAAKQANPDLKLLVGALPNWQRDLLGAAGVAVEDIVVLRSAAVVESLISPMPGYTIGRYVSEQAIDTYRRIQAGMPQVSGPGDELVFLTREPGLWRECSNAADLEGYFVERGFALHRPEQYTLAEQAALYRDAKVVAGYIGSQLYGQVFAPQPLQVIGFVNASYGSSNEFFMAAALGHTLHQFWGVEHPPRRTTDVQGRPLTPAHADYDFDFDADGATLADLLDQVTGISSSRVDVTSGFTRGGWRRRRPSN